MGRGTEDSPYLGVSAEHIGKKTSEGTSGTSASPQELFDPGQQIIPYLVTKKKQTKTSICRCTAKKKKQMFKEKIKRSER